MEVSSMENDDKQVTESTNPEKTNESNDLDTNIGDSTSNTATEFDNIQFPDEILPTNKEISTSSDGTKDTETGDEKEEISNNNDDKVDYDFTSELLENCDVGDMLTKTSEVNSITDESTENTNSKSEQTLEQVKETFQNHETDHSTQEVDNSENVETINNDNDDNNAINKLDEPVNMEEDKIDENNKVSPKTNDVNSDETKLETDEIEKPNDNNEEDVEKSDDNKDESNVNLTSQKESDAEKGDNDNDNNNDNNNDDNNHDNNDDNNDNETIQQTEKEDKDESVTRSEEIVEDKTEESEEIKDVEDDMKMDTSEETTEKVPDKSDEVKDEEVKTMDTTDDNTDDKSDEVNEVVKEINTDNLQEKMDTTDDKMSDDKDEDTKEVENKETDITDKVEDKIETNIDEASREEIEEDKVDKDDEKTDDKISKDTEDTDKSMDVDDGESKNVSEIDENSQDKDEQTNNIEYVDLGKEIIDDNKDDSQIDSLENTTNTEPEENPLLVDKDETNIEPEIEQETEAENETEEVEQDQEQDKENTSKEDSVDDDTVASDEVITGLENADEALCMIPEQEPAQGEKDENFLTRCAPPPPKEFTIKTANSDSLETCRQCKLKRKASFHVTRRNQENGNVDEYICSQTCLEVFQKENKDNYFLEYNQIRIRNFTKTPEMASMQEERACTFCKNKTDDEENNLTWELMDFCNEFCLWKYQKQVGSQCATCSVEVPPNSLGKYCVRFGDDIRQFCSSNCLEDYKKGLKVCSYCQQDMSKNTEGFLAPVGDKGQFKDFCSQKCMEKYDIMTNNRPPKVDKDTRCSVCDNDNDITIEFETKDGKNYFCSDRCFVAFSFVNNIIASRCSMCRRYYSNEILRKRTVFYDNVQYNFCSNSCHNIYIIAHRKIVPCAWCKVKKYNFDMIRRYFKGGTIINMCSIHCLNLFQVSINAVNSKKTLCNFCNKRHQPMYHLTMSDASIRNFCSYNCVMSFQNKFKKSPITLNNGNEESSYPVPAGEPKKSRKFSLGDNTGKSVSPPLPVISNVQSLANKNNQSGSVNGRNKVATSTTSTTQTTTTTNNQPHILNAGVTGDAGFRIKHHIIIKPAPVPEQRNVATMCKVRTLNKITQYKPLIYDKAIQTDKEVQKAVIPVPVPLILPVPTPIYSIPVPYPVPIPIPIPIPIFIPTTRNSAKGIMKEIKKIQVKIPTDPYEAELLMMAEMVAGDKKEENTDSESDVEDNTATAGGTSSGGGGTGGGNDEGTFSPEPVDASNTFGDDMLQMALKMATELEAPAVDLEGALTANTITASQSGEVQNEESVDDPQPLLNIPDRRGRKRGSRGGKQSSSSSNKRRRISQQSEACVAVLPPQPVAPPEPTEKPDAHLCLKYTFGVNAWKQWVTTKNQAEMEKSSKFVKPFKTEILQLTADELNYSLCLFVKEVRKPNGAEYAPDTIYYLCLGIQQYLFENGRIDNIFCDPYYEQFTDSLDEVARKFSVLYNDSHYIVTRVEEEHLWESKQLGAHSPHVLLSTLMFFNTKHFNLTTVEEHMQLSFSHIMKHWKRNPNQSGVARTPGSRNVLLRFYPPQSAMQNNARKKKVYEQQENEENPLRCPVKLYEFYLSKCPESVKTRNDVFYLQPERSCVPDSPVWYSTTALPREALEKMLHRVKMVKEINVALLTS